MNEAVQLYNKQLSVVSTPMPKISNPQEVLVKVAFAGVCGTDLHILHGEFPSSPSAVVLGHEFCGTVEQVGEDVKHIAVGDRVVVNPNDCCHSCRYCTRGQPHFCKTGGIRSAVGIWKNGGWARYCKVPGVLAFPLPQEIPMNLGVFCEPYSCIARGWEKMEPIRSDADILICGAGFRDFVITELSERRRNVACALGLGVKAVHPEHLVNQYREAKREGNEDWGFDVIVDCTGNPKAIEQEFTFLRRGAKLVLFGCCPENSEIKLDPFQICIKEVTIVGSLINPYTFPKAILLVKDMGEKYLNYDKLGVKTFQLQDYPAALESLKKGDIAKAVFQIHQSSS